jgi:3-oxoadipate enol-lactonase
MPYAYNSDVKIYWDDQGQGEPVLLIMGLGYPSDMWFRTRPVLNEQYRTIALDNRGVGKTDSPPGPYPIPVMAEDAAKVIKAAGCDQVHVIGVSMGGMIAQELALLHPELVKSLVLGCTTPGGPIAVPAAPEVLATLMARGNMTADEGVRAMIPFIYDESTPRERVEEDLTVRLRSFPSAESYFAQVQGVMGFDSYSRLPQLKVKTLVIHGENDLLIPAVNGRLLAEAIPGAKLVMLPNASHIFVTDQPEASEQALKDFLASAA